jgi:hypothetical protein
LGVHKILKIIGQNFPKNLSTDHCFQTWSRWAIALQAVGFQAEIFSCTSSGGIPSWNLQQLNFKRPNFKLKSSTAALQTAEFQAEIFNCYTSNGRISSWNLLRLTFKRPNFKLKLSATELQAAKLQGGWHPEIFCQAAEFQAEILCGWPSNERNFLQPTFKVAKIFCDWPSRDRISSKNLLQLTFKRPNFKLELPATELQATKLQGANTLRFFAKRPNFKLKISAADLQAGQIFCSRPSRGQNLLRSTFKWPNFKLKSSAAGLQAAEPQAETFSNWTSGGQTSKRLTPWDFLPSGRISSWNSLRMSFKQAKISAVDLQEAKISCHRPEFKLRISAAGLDALLGQKMKKQSEIFWAWLPSDQTSKRPNFKLKISAVDLQATELEPEIFHRWSLRSWFLRDNVAQLSSCLFTTQPTQ